MCCRVHWVKDLLLQVRVGSDGFTAGLQKCLRWHKERSNVVRKEHSEKVELASLNGCQFVLV